MIAQIGIRALDLVAASFAICSWTNGASGAGGVASGPIHAGAKSMNNIIYIVGLIVVIGFILGFFGLR